MRKRGVNNARTALSMILSGAMLFVMLFSNVSFQSKVVKAETSSENAIGQPKLKTDFDRPTGGENWYDEMWH